MSFPARHESQCSDCGERIHMGDLIEFDGETGVDRWVHVDCDDAAEESTLDRDAKREVCTECWLLKPCGCDS